MNKVEFIEILEGNSRNYSNRPILVEAILINPNWITLLLDKMNLLDEKESNFAARILELSCKVNLNLILPYLNNFMLILPNLKHDGSIRSSAKIIELIMIQLFIKSNPIFVEKLNLEYLNKCTEFCFDWILNKNATAIHVHSIYSLYLLGSKFDWIHNELVQNIEKNLSHGSVGYQNRAKKILIAIRTNKLFKLY